jgi:DNA-binding GntR family transcriptional regulator
LEEHLSVIPEPAALGVVSTVDALVVSLRDEILSGATPAGAALKEGELCQRFGVSRHSLRTALANLIHNGLLRQQPNRSVYVPELTPPDVQDIYDLRILIEVEAVKFLCSSPERLGPVREASMHLLNLSPEATWNELRDRDLEFHSSLVTAMGRPRTIRAIGALQGELRLAFLQIQAQFEDRDQVVAEHIEMFDAIACGDAERAVSLLRSHLVTACKDICEALST